jgi:hypothetical protein
LYPVGIVDEAVDRLIENARVYGEKQKARFPEDPKRGFGKPVL